MKTAVSNSPNEEIHERIEMNGTNKSNKFNNSGETKVRRREPQKARKAKKLTQTVESAMTKQRMDNMC